MKSTSQISSSARGVEQGDGAAVAVAEEPGLFVKADRSEERRQHFISLAMHEVDIPALVVVARRRTSICGA